MDGTFTDDYGVPPKYIGSGVQPTYTRVVYNQPHWKRKSLLLKVHPEISKLQGYDIMSAVYIVGIVLAQTILAYLLRDHKFWVVFIVAYIFGATMDHAMWVLIHDCTHNTVLPGKKANKFLHWVANIPLIIPCTISFRYFHLMHHAYLNETYNDPDVPALWEDKIFGHSALGKTLFLFFFPISQAIRVTCRFESSAQPKLDIWLIGNFVVQILYSAFILYYFGYMAFIYLFISNYFAVGLHPMGARWIAEHYAVEPNQETYSYYGVLNKVSFNIGYHNEHHDVPSVPWSKLPLLTKHAPEFYKPLVNHNSYLGVLRQFIFNPKFTLQTRVTRISANKKYT